MIVLTEPCIPPSDVFGLKYPPLALACLANVLRREGCDFRLFVHEQHHTDEQWLADVLSVEPDVVGFSVFMGYKLETAYRLSALLRARAPHVKILWGGVHPSVTVEETLRDPNVDWVCVGPGETTVLEIARYLKGERPLDGIPSLARLVDGQVVMSGPGIPRRDPAIARPDWDSFDVEDFVFEAAEGYKVLGFIASRGCVHDCGFCYIGSFYGRAWQPSKPEDVQAEMLMLRERYGVKGFIFLDDLFFTNPNRAVEILKFMAQNDLVAHAIDIRLDQVSREIMDALRAAKCAGVFIGVESANDRVLDVMTKGSDRACLIRAMEILNDYPDILLWLNVLLGTPTETFEEMTDTISTLAKLAKRPNTLVNMNAFYPLPGTHLFPLALEHGFKAPTTLRGWSELAEPRITNLDHFPGRLTEEQTLHLQRAARYLRMQFRAYPAGRRSLSRRVASWIFSRAATARLSFGVLDMPVDLWAYEGLRSLKSRLKKPKRSAPADEPAVAVS